MGEEDVGLTVAVALFSFTLWIYKYMISCDPLHDDPCEEVTWIGAAVSLVLTPVTLCVWLLSSLYSLLIFLIVIPLTCVCALLNLIASVVMICLQLLMGIGQVVMFFLMLLVLYRLAGIENILRRRARC